MTFEQSMPEGLTHLPILLLNVHEQCNCRCQMCDIWQRKDGREIDLQRLTAQRESIRRLGVRQVVLTGGEPLMHRNFDTLCEFLKSCGVRITLLTTGLLLLKRSTAISEWIDEVIVSMDGPEATHDRVRGVSGAFRLMDAGIATIRMRRPHVPVHARTTVQKANHRELRQTVKAAKELALDSISFLAADVTSQAFNRELVWPVERQKQIALTREEVSDLEDEMELLIRDHQSDIESGYIVETEDKLRRIVRQFRVQLGELLPIAPRCNAPWVSAVLEVDGTVRPCFFHRGIGNAHANNLEHAINSEEGRKFRASLNVSENSVCQRCVCSLNYTERPELHCVDEPVTIADN